MPDQSNNNPSFIRSELINFANLMETKLRSKDNEKGHWSDVSIFDLWDKLLEEIHELNDELMIIKENEDDREKINKIIDECSDIANVSMMIADNISKMKK